MDNDDILYRALAYHEAGHQVIADALSVPVRGVEIRPDGGHAYDGLRFRQYNLEVMSAGDWEHFRSRALILLGGEAAEQAFYDLEGVPAEGLWSGPDRDALREHVQQLFEGCTPVAYRHEALRIDVEKLILSNWMKVVRVAERLLEKGSLSGLEVVALLRPSGIFWGDD